MRIISENTILKAIHNVLGRVILSYGLRIISENTILKAIHNPFKGVGNVIAVENHKRKYNFESNSQLAFVYWCVNEIENHKRKYNFESNSQPLFVRAKSNRVENHKRKYNFESNSQHVFKPNKIPNS